MSSFWSTSPPGWALWLLGIAAVLAAFYAALPKIARPVLRGLLAMRYDIERPGLEHVPETGPALVASNHISWIDGFLIYAACPRRVRPLVNRRFIDLPVLRHLARDRLGLIPVPQGKPKGVLAAVAEAREALQRGEVVLIMPEGYISRIGQTRRFLRGIEAIEGSGLSDALRRGMGPDAPAADRIEVPVIPAFLDNLWGSLFSYSGGRAFLKWPKGWRRRVVVAFGPPVPPPITAFKVRRAVLEAGVRARERLGDEKGLPETIDRSLPHLDHPELGLLAAPARDDERRSGLQVGSRPGTVGRAVPGVALLVVDDDGRPLGPDATGRLQALVPGRADWADTGLDAAIDRDGFVHLS